MDDLLDDLTDLAASGPPATEFFAAVLAAATKSTNAIAGAVWSAVDGSFRLEQQVGLVALGLGNDPALQRMHEEALAQARQAPVERRIKTILRAVSIGVTSRADTATTEWLNING